MRKCILSLVLLTFSLGFSQGNFDVTSIEQFQNELNKQFADEDSSPLTNEDRLNFTSLNFFPISEKFHVIADFIRTENEEPFEMKTSTERKPLYVKYGQLIFVINGIGHSLNVYKNIELSKKEAYKDYLFLPFSDLTCGENSYIGGRYIDLKVPVGNSISIDFNKAYNPYCAYNHKYSCPIVPLENDLKVAIEAGVMKFHE
jgi:uncharacterized protein (DUF1684 family)